MTTAAIDNYWLPSFMFEFDKMYITGRMVDDEWVKPWMQEYICLVIYLIDMNSEANDQMWAMMKWECLNEDIQ